MVILAAVDGEQISDGVVTTGSSLARAYGEELVVLHVMPQQRFDERQRATSDHSATSLAPDVNYGSADERRSTARNSSERYTIDADGEPDAETVARDVVEATLDDTSGVSVQGRVGEPTREILDEAERRDARYLVVGGRKRSPVGKAVFGSVTQSILLNAHRPVVAIMEGG